MTVRELIERLATCDPSAVVVVVVEHDGPYVPVLRAVPLDLVDRGGWLSDARVGDIATQQACVYLSAYEQG
jgi:hypothetical protein